MLYLKCARERMVRTAIITSKEIAELAGVSRGTVDRVLNRRGGVRAEVEKQVLEIAAQWGYEPNRAGKALVTRKKISLGVVVNALGNPFYDEVLRGMEAAAADFSDFSISLVMKKIKGYRMEEQR
ncbi:MAG: LacI family DNA-binding transcriptional regulator, partial [Clostridia bacterium]